MFSSYSLFKPFFLFSAPPVVPVPLLLDGTAFELLVVVVVVVAFTLTARASAAVGSTFWSFPALLAFVVAACRGSTVPPLAVDALDGGFVVVGAAEASAAAGLTLFSETKGVAPGVLCRVVAPGETDRVLVVGGASLVVVDVVVVVVVVVAVGCSAGAVAAAAAGLESGITEGTSNSGGRVCNNTKPTESRKPS